MKQIGIIMSKVYKALDRKQLRGILTELFANDCNALVFTINEEFFDPKVKTGELNLLNAISFDRLDGMIYLPFSFSDSELMQEIERRLHENCKKPVICIGTDSSFDARVWFNDTAHFQALTNHLIAEHSCRTLICLTGPKHMETSQHRAAGFCSAVNAAGLDIPESAVIYGDYWVKSAQKLAAELLDGSRPLPDAIVCGNDTMAITLCDALSAGGIRIPQQVRITGYDHTPDAVYHIPSITTYAPDTERLGAAAAARLLDLIHRRKPETDDLANGCMICGESCGHPRQDSRVAGYDYEQMEAGCTDTSLPTRLIACENFNALIRNVYEMTYTFSDSNYRSESAYRLCLCTDWNDASFDGISETYRTNGYTPQLISTNMQNNELLFDAVQMIPPDLRCDVPSVYYFSAARFRDHCFGWSVLRFNGIPDGYDVFYPRFCREVNNALAFLHLQNNYRSLAYRSFIASSRDPLTGLYLFERCPQMWDDTAAFAERCGEDIYILLLELGGLRQIEDADSRIEREQHIVAFTEILQRIHSSKEKVFRISGDLFAVIGSERTPAKRPELLTQTVTEMFHEANREQAAAYTLSVRTYTLILPNAEPHTFADAHAGIQNAIEELRRTAQPSYQTKLHDSELAALRREIYSQPEEDWDIALCCRRMNMSRSYLQKIYTQTFGVSCAQDIQNSKIQHAKQLLLHTNLTLQNIALKCGYDYSHFMRLFKKETGMTPTDYRKGKPDA